ncbi:hypothetical protein CON64_18490 [Bacillus pseudomycoides]|nr:hypothetical protein CON64_18490 [Bacillus pseudomycoides]
MKRGAVNASHLSLEETIEELLPLAKQLSSKGTDEELIKLVLKITIRKVLEYINWEELPSGLYEIVCEMAVKQLFTYETGISNSTDNISSIKRGDYQVTYSSNQFQKSLGLNLLTEYRTFLNKYKRLQTI